MARVFNFSAGPAVLPGPVLEQAQRELRDVCSDPGLLGGHGEGGEDAMLGDIAAGVERAGSIALVGTKHGANAWVIENVATRPEFRRRGLVDRLIQEMLERGRSHDATTAEIEVVVR